MQGVLLNVSILFISGEAIKDYLVLGLCDREIKRRDEILDVTRKFLLGNSDLVKIFNLSDVQHF